MKSFYSNNRQVFKPKSIWKLLALLLLPIAVLSSCEEQFDPNTISNLERYNEAKKIIIENLDTIKLAVDFHNYDSVKQISPSIIFRANRYYFENTIAANHNDKLQRILRLWEDKLISADGVFGTITLTTDSALIFQTGFDNVGKFSVIGHYIIYDPKDKNAKLGQINSEILKEKDLGDHWKYIIEKKYYVD